MHPAWSADLSPVYPDVPVYSEPDPQFEFGTGWYLRGDASYGNEDQASLRSAFGNVKLHPDWAYAAGGGVGYRFNSFFRVDVTGDYLEPLKATSPAMPADNGATGITKVSLGRYDGLVNGYFDLGNWSGVTPYIGAGVGFGVVDPSAKIVTTDALGQRTTVNRTIEDRTNFAWAAMAGVSYAIDSNVDVDLGYRHLDLGRASVTVNGATVKTDNTRDEVRLGLRYMLN